MAVAQVSLLSLLLLYSVEIVSFSSPVPSSAAAFALCQSFTCLELSRHRRKKKRWSEYNSETGVLRRFDSLV